jgi:hypothetical protein
MLFSIVCYVDREQGNKLNIETSSKDSKTSPLSSSSVKPVTPESASIYSGSSPRKRKSTSSVFEDKVKLESLVKDTSIPSSVKEDDEKVHLSTGYVQD